MTSAGILQPPNTYVNPICLVVFEMRRKIGRIIGLIFRVAGGRDDLLRPHL
jgi:hypothetical protein